MSPGVRSEMLLKVVFKAINDIMEHIGLVRSLLVFEIISTYPYFAHTFRSKEQE